MLNGRAVFDSVLGEGNVPKRRLGMGAAISVLLHVVVVAGAIWLSTREAMHGAKEAAITFFAPPPPPPPPAGSKNTGAEKPKVERKRTVPKVEKIVQPTEIPQQPKPAEPEPVAGPEEPAGQPGGVAGGVAGGVEGGVVGGQVGGVLGGTLSFGVGMTRPVRLSGDDPFYTREALEARVEGTVIAECIITEEGTLQNCRILKSQQHMDKAVLDALATHRYKPVTFQGRPVTVRYKFPIRLVLPHR